MLNVNLLRGAYVSRGFNQASLSKALGFKTQTFKRKIDGTSTFTLDEVQKMKELLSLTSDELIAIFFS